MTRSDLPYRHFFGGESSGEGARKIPAATPWLGLSAFWATVVRVELTDIVFAIDSIVVAVAMSQKTWVVLTGGILGIIAMRLVIGQLLAVVERYPLLVDGAFVIIAWVGTRLFVHYLHAVGWISWDIPEWLGYTLIVTIFVVALAWARIDERRKGGPPDRGGRRAGVGDRGLTSCRLTLAAPRSVRTPARAC